MQGTNLTAHLGWSSKRALCDLSTMSGHHLTASCSRGLTHAASWRGDELPHRPGYMVLLHHGCQSWCMNDISSSQCGFALADLARSKQQSMHAGAMLLATQRQPIQIANQGIHKRCTLVLPHLIHLPSAKVLRSTDDTQKSAKVSRNLDDTQKAPYLIWCATCYLASFEENGSRRLLCMPSCNLLATDKDSVKQICRLQPFELPALNFGMAVCDDQHLVALPPQLSHHLLLGSTSSQLCSN